MASDLSLYFCAPFSSYGCLSLIFFSIWHWTLFYPAPLILTWLLLQTLLSYQGTFAVWEVRSQISQSSFGGISPANNSIILYLSAYKVCFTYNLRIFVMHMTAKELSCLHSHCPYFLRAVCSILMEYSGNGVFKVILVGSPIKQKCKYRCSQLVFLAISLRLS